MRCLLLNESLMSSKQAQGHLRPVVLPWPDFHPDPCTPETSDRNALPVGSPDLPPGDPLRFLMLPSDQLFAGRLHRCPV